MTNRRWSTKVMTRREYLRLMGLIASGTLLGACTGVPAAPQQTGAEPAAPAPAEGVAPTREVDIVLPTDTPIPAPTEVPLWSNAVELRQQVHWEGDRFNDYKALCDQWNLGPGKDANIYIHTERHGATGDEPEWAAFYMADFLAGTSPDIYHLSGGMLPDLQAQGVLVAPVDEIQQYIKDNYAPGAVAYATVEGATYGYPTELQAQVNWINAKHLQDAGLDPDPANQPKTWDEMREQAKALTVREGDKKTRAGFIHPDGYDEQQFINRVIMHEAEGEPYVDIDNLKTNANSEVGQAIMKLWYDMAITDDSTNVGLVTIWDAYPNELGSVVQMDAWYGFFEIIANGGEELFQNSLVTLSPTSNGQNFKSEARIYLFAVTSNSKQPAEAWQFLQWLNEAPDIHMMNFMVHSFGFLPGHTGLDMPEFFTPQMVETFQQALDVSIPMPFARGLFEMYEATGSLQDAVVFGEKGWEEASQELEETINTILKEKYGG